MSEKVENVYVCATCGKTFEANWTIEEAEKEAEEFWGVKDASSQSYMEIICDDCWEQVKPNKPIRIDWSNK